MDKALMHKARGVSLAQDLNTAQDYTFSALSRVDDLIEDLQARVEALEAKVAPVPPPNVVQMTREQFDQLVESLQAIYEGTDLSYGRQTTSYTDLHDIAIEALERLGIQPE